MSNDIITHKIQEGERYERRYGDIIKKYPSNVDVRVEEIADPDNHFWLSIDIDELYDGDESIEVRYSVAEDIVRFKLSASDIKLSEGDISDIVRTVAG